MLSTSLLGLLVASLLLASGAQAQEQEWWQSTVLYQIYPRSFQDSNGDGTGDLIGITSRLDHLAEMGVGAIWLSPIFKSPMVDFGYDIANFKEIDPLFGTMEDFDALLAKAKSLGIKLLLDFVPNHTSDESEWFVQSLANDPVYADYYVWKDSLGVDADGNQIPPNNWLSVFFGSAWTYREERQQFYLHQFAAKQPDLNYRNPAVVQEMKDVFTFWLEKGVDGFRIDAIPHQFEDDRFLDEPKANGTTAEPDDNAYLEHIYTKDQPETFDMVQQWRELVDAFSAIDGVPRILVTEAYTDIDTTMQYYGTAERPGAHFSFNFLLITNVNINSTAQDFVDSIDLWINKMPEGGTANWVVGNHDQKRVASRFGEDLADGVAMIVQLLPGVGVTYNGEEIGMVNTFISWEDTQDPQGCGAGPDRYEDFSRDPVRTPFQWDDTKNAGFSTADKTWLPVNENYVSLNLAAQTLAQTSHYKTYSRLVEAKKHNTIKTGSLKTAAVAERVVAYARELASEETFVVIVNLGEDSQVIDLTATFNNLPHTLTVWTASIGANLLEGDSVIASAVPLLPKAGIVLSGLPSAKA